MSITLSVVIPCYNEGERIQNIFSVIEKEAPGDWEWVFVNDGSKDNTEEKIIEFQRRYSKLIKLVSQKKNYGKGTSIREGILNSNGAMIGFVDADLAVSPLNFKNFLKRPEIVQGKELLAGIRVKTHDRSVKRYWYRHVMGRVFQTYASIMTGLCVYDTQCGFKLLAADKAREIANQMRCNGFTFDIEMFLLALKLGMSIKEEMIPWEEKGNSSIRVGHIFKMLFEVWKIRVRLGHVESIQIEN